MKIKTVVAATPATEYRHRNCVVNDWHCRQLSAPQPGQEWVQYGGDYLLIAVATGIIAALLALWPPLRTGYQ